MANVTKNIGLSLGADLCWPACYEEIVNRLDLSIPSGEDAIRFHVERVSVEPFNLRQPVRYDMVLDRLTHWFHTSREWIKKAVVMDGLYVLNNPWSLQSMEKHTTYSAMMALGMPIPETWMVPPRELSPDNPDIYPMLERYGRKFELAEIGEKLGYPLFMKPYDGGAWVGVTKINNTQQLLKAYEQSGRRVMHLQRAVDPFDLFVRAIGIGPQVHIVRYDPDAPLHDRYKVDFFFVDGEEWSVLQDTCLTINAFFGWEFNSCESLRKEGTFYPIDFANACPDFQVTSLHFHFPELVKNMIRWSLFCAATGRKKALNLDWAPFFEIAKKDLPYRERLAGYAKIARERMEHDRFQEFVAKHLTHLDEVTWEFFGTDTAKGFVRQKVAALFPAHEVEAFTDHFFGLIQFWRKCEADRMNTAKEQATAAAAAPEVVTTPEAVRTPEVVTTPEAVTTTPVTTTPEVATPEVATPTEKAPAAEVAAQPEPAAFAPLKPAAPPKGGKGKKAKN
ncbi:ATP-grasp domain-containing protein [Nannocystis bainbridge]|uniref:D-alanine--D-alanine ligase C-terminal domain-containing protein n=1 Tax=Nannocystis bainbridge TaxID=2995303 RepID=A0ABT5E9T6_9BACT|nr:hypothetical protein [Nannocystis bainbridge]MDC0722599.1 hypothetical protein [Nannocystis bainbridge]